MTLNERIQIFNRIMGNAFSPADVEIMGMKLAKKGRVLQEES